MLPLSVATAAAAFHWSRPPTRALHCAPEVKVCASHPTAAVANVPNGRHKLKKTKVAVMEKLFCFVLSECEM